MKNLRRVGEKPSHEGVKLSVRSGRPSAALATPPCACIHEKSLIFYGCFSSRYDTRFYTRKIFEFSMDFLSRYAVAYTKNLRIFMDFLSQYVLACLRENYLCISMDASHENNLLWTDESYL